MITESALSAAAMIQFFKPPLNGSRRKSAEAPRSRTLSEERIGIAIEVKYSDGGSLETGCRNALDQIKRNRYEDRFIQDGMETIISYGIACFRKQCKV